MNYDWPLLPLNTDRRGPWVKSDRDRIFNIARAVRLSRRQHDCNCYISAPITEHKFNIVVNGASALAIGASLTLAQTPAVAKMLVVATAASVGRKRRDPRDLAYIVTVPRDPPDEKKILG